MKGAHDSVADISAMSFSAIVTYKPRIVLQTPLTDEARLEPFVEACLRDGVELIAVVGEGCERIHDTIDELVVGDGSDDSRFITTSWHPDETLEEALQLARAFGSGAPDCVQLVKL
jgi:hypothetical protein